MVAEKGFKIVTGSGKGLLRPRLRGEPTTSAFCWPKQVIMPAQIQEVGKNAPLLGGESCKGTFERTGMQRGREWIHFLQLTTLMNVPPSSSSPSLTLTSTSIANFHNFYCLHFLVSPPLHPYFRHFSIEES